MSSNPPPYPPPPGGGQQPPYGPPPGSQGGQPYGPPPGAPAGQPYGPPAGAPQPAYGTPYGPPGQAGFGAPPAGAPSKRWYQRWWVWLVIVIALLVVGGIAYGVNHATGYQLESKIKDLAKKQGVTLTNLHCPSSINTDKGRTYDCTADVNGTAATLHVVFVADKKFEVSQQ